MVLRSRAAFRVRSELLQRKLDGRVQSQSAMYGPRQKISRQAGLENAKPRFR
jgi:hypothetical protein